MKSLHTATIFFVGPLPPPVHGFSEINRRMLIALRSRHQVLAFDMTPRASRLSFLFILWRFLLCVVRRRPKALYLALSGGYRQWIDLAFVLLARLRDIPIFVHHHSFSYLNDRRLSAVVSLRALRDATHVVLCECMGQQLMKQYGIELVNMRVLSNSAFLEDIEAPASCMALVHAQPAALRIGFLSNITAEKGIFEFFAVLRESQALGVSLQGVIAGPVDSAIKESFSATLAASTNVQHVGAVYGVAKSAFFANIDILFFPSKLQEAEPVTILEALGHGVPVIAFARGCIEGMVPAAAGAVFSYSETFAKHAIEALRPLAENHVLLVQARHSARAIFEAGRASNKAVLESLMAEMGGNGITKPVSA
ncbi:MAG: glycosyltransferase family 4 protein [Glaciimonas sp.]|nr:glycosyltransferase family 4 protein [Glaciimonas sp.]